jgi:hypothetical protein
MPKALTLTETELKAAGAVWAMASRVKMRNMRSIRDLLTAACSSGRPSFMTTVAVSLLANGSRCSESEQEKIKRNTIIKIGTLMK